MHVVRKLQELSKRLVVVPGSDELSREAQENATLLFNILLRCTLSSKKAVMSYRLSARAFDWLVGEIRTRFYAAMPAAGPCLAPVCVLGCRALVTYTVRTSVQVKCVAFLRRSPLASPLRRCALARPPL